jgi:hypothetical protein
VQLVPQVYKDKQEPQVSRAQLEQLEQLDHKVQLDPKELQVQLDLLEQLGLAQLVQQGRLVTGIPQHRQLV